MIKKLYLHIGMDKTGTSAIQLFLYNNREKLYYEENLYYPKTGLWHDFSHHPFAFAILNVNGFNKKNLTELLTQLDSEIKNKDNVIISSECLFKVTEAENFNIFKEYICKTFDEVEIVVYVRRQDLWVESRYKHSILSGSNINLEKLQTPHFCNYKQFIDKWSIMFGKESLVVKPYEKEQFVENNIFYDFLSIFSVNVLDPYEISTANINPSLSLNACEFKRICNYLEGFEINMDGLNEILLSYSKLESEFSYHKQFLSYDERIKLLKRYETTNKMIAQEYIDTADHILFHNIHVANVCYDKYTGITKEKVLEIASYINNKNKSISKKMIKCVNRNLKSNIKDAMNAAMVLSPMQSVRN